MPVALQRAFCFWAVLRPFTKTARSELIQEVNLLNQRLPDFY
jgi:hypothetical protein